MDKKIPIYFDSLIIDSPTNPIEKISDANPNLGRIKARVFTKYGNRNGSYITDAVAEQLINSTTDGTIPVIGFFDPETKTWASHTGPNLAKAYGYVEEFLGWEPFEDTDNVTRDYAVFSIVLFINYFDEAKQVLGQNQSMELDINSIEGDWANIDGREYFVYTSAKMAGFCIIGDHEPCFSVSSFFSKTDETQSEQFSQLLFELRQEVEKIKNTSNGGEQPMEEFENQQVTEVEPAVEEPAAEPELAPQNFEEEPAAEEPAAENEAQPEAEPETEFASVEPEVESEPEPEHQPTDYELLQDQFNDLQAAYNQLNDDYQSLSTLFDAANSTIEEYKTEITNLQTSIQRYEQIEAENEKNRKISLVQKYEKIFSEEEIAQFTSMVNDLSYDELESKLAIAFANAKLSDSEENKKIPLPEPQESQFALLMKKYRKN